MAERIRGALAGSASVLSAAGMMGNTPAHTGFKRLVKRAARRFGVDIRRAGSDLLDDPLAAVGRLSGARPCSTIVDVGANVGQSALAYARRFPSARIHSLEPFADAYKLLKRNT